MSKNVKTRIQLKHDFEVNWLRANFIPLSGELIIYDSEVDKSGNVITKIINDEAVAMLPEDRTEPYTYARFKVGDGSRTINELPFTTEPYCTTAEVEALIASIPSADLDGYVTKDMLEEKGYLTQHQDISHLATKSELFSGSYNDLTNKPTIPSITGLATETFVEAAVAKVTTPDLSSYATKDDIKDFITEIPQEFVTETELASKGYLTQHQDLSLYAKKSELPDVSKFITTVPSEYITESELASKGYLTQHQSLAGLATETFVNNKVATSLDTFISCGTTDPDATITGQFYFKYSAE